MPLKITSSKVPVFLVDAIVNDANTSLKKGGDLCSAIFKAAGQARLRSACKRLAPIGIGEAVITPGFRLLARSIIHAAGPIYEGGGSGEAEKLAACYSACLDRAVENSCESVAFPLISTDVNGYPKDEAYHIAVKVIQDFLIGHEMSIFLSVPDNSVLAVSEEVIEAVDAYLVEHCLDVEYKGRRDRQRREATREATGGFAPLSEEPRFIEASVRTGSPAPQPADLGYAASGSELDSLLGNLDEAFPAALLRLIDKKGKSDVEVYKRANMDRKLFSKIRVGKGYKPSKLTAITLAVALELTLDETGDLLARAGFALSHSERFDVIVEYFIAGGRYDIFEINEVLFKYNETLLG